MSNIEKIIKLSKTIERLLNDLGGSGKGIHELTSSLTHKLNERTVKQLRFIASVRNRAIHEEGYHLEKIIKDYVNSANRLISELEKQVEALHKKSRKRSSSPRGSMSRRKPKNTLDKIGIVVISIATIATASLAIYATLVFTGLWA